MWAGDIPIFDSDDDEEIIDHIERFRAPKRFQERKNYLEDLENWEFYKRFRISKEAFGNLLRQIEPQLRSATNKNNAIEPITKLLLTLRFLATGTMLLVVADFCGVSESSACKIIECVVNAIAALRPHYVYMPRDPQEILQTQLDFYRTARFPKVIGAIDCTHIEIESPGGPDAEYYRNRKGWFSWNVQTICDSKLKIRDVVVRWPGSTHDQTIFNNSSVKRKFTNGDFGDAILVGDSGYGITPYLMTPLHNPQLHEERLYNESQIRTRNAIERSYGVWKRRFPILSLCMRVGLEKSQNIIVASAIIHNIATDEREDVPPDDEAVVELVRQHEERQRRNQQPEEINEGRILNVLNNNNRRQILINEYFRNLLHVVEN